MGYIDIHSHIIPGVDDGSQDMEQSIRMLRKAADEGIRQIILTPHNKAEHRNVSVAGIMRRVSELQEVVDGSGIPITLYTGNEIFYRDGVVDLLEEGKICTLAGSSYVLVEFQPMEQFSYIRSAIYELAGNGYIPVLAHTERYQSMICDSKNVAYAIDRGALIQVNASSVTGGMGYKVKQAVKKLLKEKLVHFVGTDAHDSEKRSPQMAECARYLAKKYGEDYAVKLLHDNADCIIRGESI